LEAGGDASVAAGDAGVARADSTQQHAPMTTRAAAAAYTAWSTTIGSMDSEFLVARAADICDERGRQMTAAECEVMRQAFWNAHRPSVAGQVSTTVMVAWLRLYLNAPDLGEGDEYAVALPDSLSEVDPQQQQQQQSASQRPVRSGAGCQSLAYSQIFGRGYCGGIGRCRGVPRQQR
jgi:hypothetical protein